MLPQPARPPTYREAYYRTLFDTFMRYIEDGERFSIHTTIVGDRTEVALRFDTASFVSYIDHLGSTP
jgi:hypothetical protein